jgi:hypothetical protein
MAQQARATFNPFDLETALETQKRIYVLNNTDPRGQLICTVNDPISGKPKDLLIPRTWIPLCLTDMLPRESLNSIELKKFFNQRTLKLMQEKEAQEVLSSPKGQKEFLRLMQSEFSVGGSGARKSAQLKVMDEAKQTALENPDAAVRDTVHIHPKIKTWEQRVMVGEMNGGALSTELEIHAPEFSLEDLQYLLSGQFPQEAKDFAYDALKTSKFRPAERAEPTAKADKAEGYEADWE